MAKIFRFSGYLVSNDSYSLQSQIDGIKDFAETDELWQQLHIDESENFILSGENEPNCDLALLTRHFKKDNSNIQFDRPVPKKGEKYKHFKLGKIVTVIGLSRHTETEERTVVYEYEGHIWNRPLEMFMGEVDKEKYPNVLQKYRFEKVVELMNRDYVIVCNEHKAIFPGYLLFWGHRTQDEESRSFGGYTSDINKCERYTAEELYNSGYKFPIYNGENEAEFKKIDDVIIKVDDLLAFDWLKTMTVVYRP